MASADPAVPSLDPRKNLENPPAPLDPPPVLFPAPSTRGPRRRGFWTTKPGLDAGIPVDAAGAEALFDAFTALPGLGAKRLLAARQTLRTGTQTLWRRDDFPDLTQVTTSGHLSPLSRPERARASPTCPSPKPAAARIERHEAVGGVPRLGVQAARPVRIGTEHEEFGYCRDTLNPLPMTGRARSRRRMLEGLQQRFGWAPISEAAISSAWKREGANIKSSSRAGQWNLSGAPPRDDPTRPATR